MRPNKSDVQLLNLEKYHTHQTILIAPDVEHIPLVSGIIDGVKRLLYVLDIAPFSGLCLYMPFSKRDG